MKVRHDPVYGDEVVVPHTCPCCERCWLIVKSDRAGRAGSCLYGGPYEGYVVIPDENKSGS